MSYTPNINILSRPINVYAIPSALLDHLAVRSIQSLEPPPLSDASLSAVSQQAPAGVMNGAGALKCQTCPGAAFESPEEQRAHFKSDWHRYNAKARLTGRAVSAEEWENMVEGVSSISGSASSSSSSGEESDTGKQTDKVARLLKRQTLRNTSANANGATGDEEDSEEEAELLDLRRRAYLRTAIIWFSPTQALPELGVPKDTQIGVHRALFPVFHRADEYLDGLRTLQLGPLGQEDEEERRITLLMVAGGHFAGMVVGLRPKSGKEKQDVKGAGDVRVLKHKTFHRYTTRKKQGGSQGLNDNAKSKANSAGAMLRRYGEQALQDEIRALMIDWEEDLEASEKIFLRASTHGKKSFWGYEGAVLQKNDERIRTFPFPTRRPTQQELLRSYHELTRLQVSHLSEETLRANDEAYIASLQPRKAPIPKPAPPPVASVAPSRDLEEEARQDRLKRLTEMIRKGRLDALKPFYEKHSSEWADAGLLGIAASAGQEEVLRYFLEELNLDPTKPGKDGRVAYDMASTKGARNVFRRVRYDNPDKWDWAAAHVPAGLSEEAEAAQGEKKAERRKGLREKMKERERLRAEQEPDEEEPVPPAVPVPNGSGTGPQKLGGGGAEGGLAGLSAEMRMKIERERRARAAEARFK